MPTGTLPNDGKKIWERVYQESLKGTCKGDKDCAASIAWKAVKNAGFMRGTDGVWHKKFDAVSEFSMRIKASYDNGTMRWKAVNSDTDPDSYDERMSLELFSDFIGRIKNKEPVPEVFRAYVASDYWNGGMPYLSVSHYPDLNGKAVPGQPLELYTDGDKLKAKGILFDSPLGRAVWKSLKEDEKKNPDNRIRISIGFLDLAHRHGDGDVWVRESDFSLCPKCVQGVGNKVYVKGYLVHLALTRVPVNKRTEMVLEEKSMNKGKKITRKEDAGSIVGEEQAAVIDNEMQTGGVAKSGVLIEMSDTKPTDEETQELVAEVEAQNAEPTEPESVEPESVEPESEPVVEPEQEPVAEPVAEQRQPSDTVKVKVETPTESVQVKSAHVLQPAIDKLLANVDNSLRLRSDIERAEIINPSLQELGVAIQEYVAKSSVSPAPNNDENDMMTQLKGLLQPIAESVKSLAEEVGVLKAQYGAQGVKSESRIPQPRTLSAQVVKSVAERPPNKPLSTDEIAKKSVGL